MKRFLEQVKWWTWGRWRIYCPSYPVSHLFIQESEPLFDYDEGFVSPCTLNEQNCGGIIGGWSPKIQFIGLKPDERFTD